LPIICIVTLPLSATGLMVFRNLMVMRI
jgi:hypothetical protein